MNHFWRAVRAILVALPLAMAAVAVWAADEDQSFYPQAAPDAYQAYDAPSSGSENIIGYRPISNEALDEAMAGSPQAGVESSQASAYQLSGPASHAPGGQPDTSDLPSAYLTGILGDGPYTLGRDDVIRIDVRSQPEFSGVFPIGFDGRIQYNYIGDIPLAGLTKYEVQQVIEKLLAPYVRVPSVNVRIVAYNSKVVYVIGEVGRPGKFVMRGDAIKLREAILAAGLPTRSAALGRVHVIKPDLTDPRVRVINIKRILYKGKLQDDVDLFPGEIVVVPSTFLSAANRFLSSLLSPASRLATAAALAAL